MTGIAARTSAATGRTPGRDPGEFQAALARGKDHCRPHRDGQRRAAAGLGHGREPCLCQPGGGRLSGALVRRGLRPRHILPSPCRAARPEPRTMGQRHLYPVAEHRARSGRFYRDRFHPVGRGGAGVRVRLRHGRAEYADHLGSAVRRFRQRRASRHRPVHRLRRSQVGQAVRPDHAVAARLRGAGAGTLVRAHRTLPAALRRLQHPGVRPVHRRADFPSVAPPDGASLSQAAHRVHAQEPAAQQGCLFPAGTVCGRHASRR